MKKLFVIAFVAFLIWLLLRQEQESPSPRVSQATPSPTPTPVWTPTPTPFVPAWKRAQPTPDARLARMQALARQSGVQLVKFQPEGNGAWVTVSWAGDQTTTGGDYVAALLKEGVVRDIDVNRKSLNQTRQDGRRIWIGSYFLIF